MIAMEIANEFPECIKLSLKNFIPKLCFKHWKHPPNWFLNDQILVKSLCPFGRHIKPDKMLIFFSFEFQDTRNIFIKISKLSSPYEIKKLKKEKKLFPKIWFYRAFFLFDFEVHIPKLNKTDHVKFLTLYSTKSPTKNNRKWFKTNIFHTWGTSTLFIWPILWQAGKKYWHNFYYIVFCYKRG